MKPRRRRAVIDPIEFAAIQWPNIKFYREQRQIIYSTLRNRETYVVAGNMLGKDFVAGYLALYFFLSRHPCRIITTSVDASQLEGVLWGEMRNFIQTAKYPLDAEQGGPLLVNHLHLRKIVNGEVCGLSYCDGRVAKKGEGFLGHHIAKNGDGIPRTFMLGDEASGLDDICQERGSTWADTMLWIGNPYDCNNFFKRGVTAGDLLAS